MAHSFLKAIFIKYFIKRETPDYMYLGIGGFLLFLALIGLLTGQIYLPSRHVLSAVADLATKPIQYWVLMNTTLFLTAAFSLYAYYDFLPLSTWMNRLDKTAQNPPKRSFFWYLGVFIAIPFIVVILLVVIAFFAGP